jgi:two-component system sensor histidine kinase YesM
MIRKIISLIDDLSIKNKLALLILALTTVPFCIFIAVNSYISSRDVETQAAYSSRKVLDQTKAFLENKTTSIKNEIYSYSLNDKVQELCTTPKSFYEQNFSNWISDSDKYRRLAFTLYYNTDISQAQLYTENGIADVLESAEFQKMSKIENSSWYQAMVTEKDISKWLPSDSFPQSGNSRYLYYVQGIRGNLSVKSFIGVLRASINESLIQAILDQAVYTKSTSIYLINSENKLVSSSTTVFSDVAEITEVLDHLGGTATDNGTWENVTIGGKKILFGVQAVANSDWRLVMTIPYGEILQLSVKTRTQMILILLAVLPFILVITFLAASSSTKRIRRLISHMRKAEKGNFDISILPSNNDEIGELTRNFNHMLTRIAMLLEDTYKLGKENKNLELKALQAQINPHFLYNSLDLINCISVKHNVPEIGQMVETLAKFYKLSLSKGEDIVSIRNEAEHVKCYVQAQNMRFQNKINLVVDIPKEVYRCSIPKIILQPLVENSILHGIFRKDEEAGTIRITGKLEKDRITLTVSDDGVGIPAEYLKDILTGSSASEAHGYGIKNINERLKINYGGESGLEYQSVESEGTTVIIRIPAVPYEKEQPPR